jgi:hypothetical protein
LRQLRGGGAQPQVQLLEPTRHLDRPAVVTEVPADLTHDGRHREGHEVRAGVDVEPDHCIDEPDASHLDEVVTGLAAPIEPAGDVIGQWQAALDDAVALPHELIRLFGDVFQLAEHVGDIRVFRVRS